ncbi:phosphate ABC transporter substrate-binding protein PstS [Acetobacter senegalensis]|uniref:phosphate ABC transporter substrate-binding protein PstS n=1 Tax=Acetobacter senegalensis TaxID=446692 RepID=UPI00264D2B3A|nr:phosphate ABC transporter substrate-binding protein PstS [Acetobacter senegalensis]MDN7354044.1 phosphate ABC transporter substrate-binding protein PstS [Acetobacter senegalensis]
MRMRCAGAFGRNVRRVAPLSVLVGALWLAGLPQCMAAERITGAGSSFAAPLYEAWSSVSEAKTGVRVNYQTIGSGAGQNQVLAGTVDFGASDAPMAPERLEKGKLLQFPTAIGGIVVIVNVPGVPDGGLKLTGPILAGLYDGTITVWNDPRIVALNPDLKLPDLPVAPLHRADGSGTTYVFTDYLSRVAPQWKETIGQGTSVAWPMGAGARGNDGIASYVRNTRGSVGYVEYAYAERNHLPTVQLQNRAGEFVTPSAESFAKAADSAEWADETLTASLCDTDGQGAWPIVTTTYALVPRAILAKPRGVAVSLFFSWGLTEGEAESRKLDYVPVPVRIRDVVLHRLGNNPPP